jgi:bifunctional enzyme CysN/CysC
MTKPDVSSNDEVREYLADQERKTLLRFLTCGSVDDGKSTLIGRLLYDSRLLFEDQLAALEGASGDTLKDSGELDFASLVDGLAAEREQGITIDVAYRFFATEKRKFIVADTPGHEQYTRNMATGASTSDLAVILIDARKGVITQTRRHSYIAHLLGVRHVVLAVNKMDLVGYDQARFGEIVREFGNFADGIGLEKFTAIPMSALNGANITTRSTLTPWYEGSSLLEHLETVDVWTDTAAAPMRLPVQWINRPHLDFRGYSGTVVSGTVRPGDEIAVMPSAKTSTIERIVTQDGDLDAAIAGQAITVTLADEIDISRGDVIAPADAAPEITDQFAAHLVWMHEEPLLPERSYLLKLSNQIVPAVVTELKYKVNVNTLEQLAAKTLKLNEIAFCNLALDRAVVYEPYGDNRDLGGFILIDRLTNNTVGAGMISFGLRRATNLVWQDLHVDKSARGRMNDQAPCVLWFTGLSGSGKSTIANLVERKLHALNRRTYVLDGDNVRHGLNKDLGFTDADRVENIRRVAEVSRLMVDAGLIVLVSFISPFRNERRMARDMVEEGEFLEIFVDTPLDVCESRDPKGLYEKARAGDIKNFTGIDSPYEAPENAEIGLDTTTLDADAAADRVIAILKERRMII